MRPKIIRFPRHNWINFLSVLIFLTFLTSDVRGQDLNQQQKNRFIHEIGLRLGSTTGAGLSYCIWYKKVGFELAFIPTFNSKVGSSSVIGAGILTILKEHEAINLIGFIGSTYYRVPTTSTQAAYAELNAGLGGGLYFTLLEVISVQVLTGYGVFDVIDDFKAHITMELGLYYRL